MGSHRPCPFTNDSHGDVTKDAGRIAGLDVLRIINGAHGVPSAWPRLDKVDDGKLVAVFDLGGGTFDVYTASLWCI